jgi:hypothetical protein
MAGQHVLYYTIHTTQTDPKDDGLALTITVGNFQVSVLKISYNE